MSMNETSQKTDWPALERALAECETFRRACIERAGAKHDSPWDCRSHVDEIRDGELSIPAANAIDEVRWNLLQHRKEIENAE